MRSTLAPSCQPFDTEACPSATGSVRAIGPLGATRNHFCAAGRTSPMRATGRARNRHPAPRAHRAQGHVRLGGPSARQLLSTMPADHAPFAHHRSIVVAVILLDVGLGQPPLKGWGACTCTHQLTSRPTSLPSPTPPFDASSKGILQLLKGFCNRKTRSTDVANRGCSSHSSSRPDCCVSRMLVLPQEESRSPLTFQLLFLLELLAPPPLGCRSPHVQIWPSHRLCVLPTT